MYLFNPVYRAMYRINLEYNKFKKRMPGPMVGYPLEATKKYFIWYFNYAVLWEYLPEKFYNSAVVHNTWVEILSNPEFILENLGADKYSYSTHKKIWAKWEELKRRYDLMNKQLED